ncbi:MAG: serine/threonine protein kinase, partial [Actinobacteria bacterium]
MEEHGLILDRYRPLALLGEGGHGSVVLAYDTKMARRVAIKRLPLPLSEDGRPVSKRGLGEARTAALLNHPGIVTVHEWDTDADEAFLIMEHVDGLPLSELLDRTGAPLDLDEIAAVVADVAAALRFAHDNGVLHLDLKPDNVLITREGRIKIADFGVAALTGLGGHAPGLGGTLGYMPLEQLVGEQLDERCDEWALAALTYEMLTGRNPFAADRVDDAIFRIELEDAPAPSDLVRRLPAGIDGVVMTGLAPHRGQRYRTVAEFASDLTPHLGDPQAGRDSLGRLVCALAEEADEGVPLEGLGLWDRLSNRGHLVSRAGATAAASWCAYSALTHLELPPAAEWVAGAVVAACAWAAPPLGLALGLLAVVAAEAVAAGPWLAVLVFAAVAAYWWFVGRSGKGYAFTPILAPAFAVARCGFAIPMLLGFAFGPAWAALSSALSAAVVMTTAAAYRPIAPYLSVPLRFFSEPWNLGEHGGAGAVWANPGAYVTVAAWGLAGLMMSLLSRRGTRRAAAAGMAAATAALVIGYVVWG